MYGDVVYKNWFTRIGERKLFRVNSFVSHLRELFCQWFACREWAMCFSNQPGSLLLKCGKVVRFLRDIIAISLTSYREQVTLRDYNLLPQVIWASRTMGSLQLTR